MWPTCASAGKYAQRESLKQSHIFDSNVARCGHCHHGIVRVASHTTNTTVNSGKTWVHAGAGSTCAEYKQLNVTAIGLALGFEPCRPLQTWFAQTCNRYARGHCDRCTSDPAWLR